MFLKLILLLIRRDTTKVRYYVCSELAFDKQIEEKLRKVCIVLGLKYIFAKQASRMAYNNRNTLLKIIRVQDIVLEQKRHGVTQLYTYEHFVRDRFLISYSTFNRWLSYPAKQELKHGKRPAPDERQLSLRF